MKLLCSMLLPLVLFLNAQTVSATSITADAYGSSTPITKYMPILDSSFQPVDYDPSEGTWTPLDPFGMTETDWMANRGQYTFSNSIAPAITNGAFTIKQSGYDPWWEASSNPQGKGNTIGDGSNENTDWTFDFSAYSTGGFDWSKPLTSAYLILDLRITDPFYEGDILHIEGLSDVATATFWESPTGILGATQLTIELLGTASDYTSGNILGALDAWKLEMEYYDDAILAHASLTLSNDPSAAVPEPSTFLIWSLGLIGLVWYGRRRRTK